MHIIIFIIILSATLIGATLPVRAVSIEDGDLVTTEDSADIYIVKTVDDKKFKRLILNPEIFNSYGHLRWGDVEEVSKEFLNTFTTSTLVREINPDGSVADPKIYEVTSAKDSDVGERQWLNLTSAEFEKMGYDWDAIYDINHTEASPDFYPTKDPITFDASVYTRDHFVVNKNDERAEILENLELEGYIEGTTAFESQLPAYVEPGGYALDKSMTQAEVASKLEGSPAMIWVTIPEGNRKEEIGEKLASKLGWSAVQEESWLTAYKQLGYESHENPEDYKEGVYFPSTYLFPRTEGPVLAASRMVNTFNDRFEGYPDAFTAEHEIGWQDALTLASMVQREASGREDARIVAGILWNRIERDMAFQLDATIQYAVNTAETGWWAPISSSDRDVESPFNTYTNKGIPPHPISNPGMVSIDAVLNPEETDCIFFIHAEGQIYCSATLEGHRENIERYF